MTNPFRDSGIVMGARGSSKGPLPKDYFSPRSRDYGSPPRQKQIQAYISIPEQKVDPIAHIRFAIEASREILDLGEDWDGNGSIAYDTATKKVGCGQAYLRITAVACRPIGKNTRRR